MSGASEAEWDDFLPPIVESEPTPPAADDQLSVQLRIKFVLTGIVIPILCFLAAVPAIPTLDQPWQSGQLQHYVVLLIKWPGFAPTLPLIALSAACLGTWVVRPTTAKYLPVQMGIFSGMILAGQFFVYILITTACFTLFAAAIIAALLAAVVAAFHWFAKHVKRFAIRHLLILTTAIALLIPVVQLTGGWEYALAAVASVSFLVVAAGPTLCVVTYARASYWILAHARKHPFPHYGAAWLAWLITWGVTWKLSVDIMLREYAMLPTTDPNCYVSTAAARGHRRLVGGKQRCGMNVQTRRLKFMELAMWAAFPQCHRRVRQVYDRVGPPLARVCRSNVWIADTSFLMLKPLEWSALLLAKATRFRL